jgi:hypothetical protein
MIDSGEFLLGHCWGHPNAFAESSAAASLAGLVACPVSSAAFVGHGFDGRAKVGQLATELRQDLRNLGRHRQPVVALVEFVCPLVIPAPLAGFEIGRVRSPAPPARSGKATGRLEPSEVGIS